MSNHKVGTKVIGTKGPFTGIIGYVAARLVVKGRVQYHIDWTEMVPEHGNGSFEKSRNFKVVD